MENSILKTVKKLEERADYDRREQLVALQIAKQRKDPVYRDLLIAKREDLFRKLKVSLEAERKAYSNDNSLGLSLESARNLVLKLIDEINNINKQIENFDKPKEN